MLTIDLIVQKAAEICRTQDKYNARTDGSEPYYVPVDAGTSLILAYSLLVGDDQEKALEVMTDMVTNFDQTRLNYGEADGDHFADYVGSLINVSGETFCPLVIALVPGYDQLVAERTALYA